MNRDIVWTNQFKKDYKLRTTNLLKNGISTLIFWIISSAPYHMGNRSQRKTETTL